MVIPCQKQFMVFKVLFERNSILKITERYNNYKLWPTLRTVQGHEHSLRLISGLFFK